ncbi:MAG TPA: hypothetical protein VE961_27720 [Pyrinomonadaceae bacterium]|nr:hypothetical protein [Pyrinomonadaceae bacterium]
MGHKDILNLVLPEEPPLIGKCANCGFEIFASHPYSWCVKCNEALPYRLNMERRPIMYEKFSVWPFDMNSVEELVLHSSRA